MTTPATAPASTQGSTDAKPADAQSALPLDAKPADAKPEAKASPYSKEAKPEEKADEKAEPKAVELEFPKGFDEKAGATLKTLAGQLGLDAAKGKVLVDAYVTAQAAAQKTYEESLAKQTDAWKAELKADASVKAAGGFDASMRLVDRLVTRFDPKGELSDVLERSGLAFHPGVVRFLASIAVSLKEDTVAGTASAPAKDVDALAALRAQYPNHPVASKE